jgi:hypothetical protein
MAQLNWSYLTAVHSTLTGAVDQSNMQSHASQVRPVQGRPCWPMPGQHSWAGTWAGMTCRRTVILLLLSSYTAPTQGQHSDCTQAAGHHCPHTISTWTCRGCPRCMPCSTLSRQGRRRSARRALGGWAPAAASRMLSALLRWPPTSPAADQQSGC